MLAILRDFRSPGLVQDSSSRFHANAINILERPIRDNLHSRVSNLGWPSLENTDVINKVRQFCKEVLLKDGFMISVPNFLQARIACTCIVFVRPEL